MSEAWLSGPVDGVAPVFQPVAHALLQAREDIRQAAAGLPVDLLWKEPGGAAAAGFHLLHLVGSLDRLLTYARGEVLSAEQRRALEDERRPHPDLDAAALVARVEAALDRALGQVRSTSPETVFEARRVGRDGLPSTVLGLLFHAAEHTTRHAGQFITTVKIVTGRGSG
jgi:hypothetical protein